MKKNKIIFLVLIFCLIIFAFFLYRFFDLRFANTRYYSAETFDIIMLLHRYIFLNGEFPASEADLEQKGFLHKNITNDGIRYWICLNQGGEHEYWREAALWQDFKISYGIKIEDIKIEDDALYNKNNDKQILLVEGPYQKGFRKYLRTKVYEPWTLDLYKRMLNPTYIQCLI